MIDKMNKVLAMFVGAMILFGAQTMLAEAGRPSPEDSDIELWGDDCQYVVEFYVRCFNIIIDQNRQIIEKLDWQNCILKHKEARQYDPPNDYAPNGWVTQSYYQLEQHCGEMP